MKKLIIFLALLFNLVPYYYEKGSLKMAGEVYAQSPFGEEEDQCPCCPRKNTGDTGDDQYCPYANQYYGECRGKTKCDCCGEWDCEKAKLGLACEGGRHHDPDGGDGGYCGCCHTYTCATPNRCSECYSEPCGCCGSSLCSTPNSCSACEILRPCSCCGSTTCANKDNCGACNGQTPCSCCGSNYCPSPNNCSACIDNPKKCVCGHPNCSLSHKLACGKIHCDNFCDCPKCCMGHVNCQIDHCAAAIKCTVKGCGKILTAIPGCSCGDICPDDHCPCCKIASCLHPGHCVGCDPCNPKNSAYNATTCACNTFDERIKKVLNFEGGFVDNPNDPGGATNKGITFNTWKAFAKKDLGIEPELDSLKVITDDQAKTIYKNEYWDPIKADDIIDGDLRFLFFDFFVNAGNGATKVLQKTIIELGDSSIVADGKIGKKTIDAINSSDPIDLYNLFLTNRLIFYTDLADKNVNLSVFSSGWTNRVFEFKHKYSSDEFNVNCK